jgi:hypothetical protein
MFSVHHIEDDEHEEVIHRKTGHSHAEGSRGWPAGQRAVPEVQYSGRHVLNLAKEGLRPERL